MRRIFVVGMHHNAQTLGTYAEVTVPRDVHDVSILTFSSRVAKVKGVWFNGTPQLMGRAFPAYCFPPRMPNVNLGSLRAGDRVSVLIGGRRSKVALRCEVREPG